MSNTNAPHKMVPAHLVDLISYGFSPSCSQHPSCPDLLKAPGHATHFLSLELLICLKCISPCRIPFTLSVLVQMLPPQIGLVWRCLNPALTQLYVHFFTTFYVFCLYESRGLDHIVCCAFFMLSTSMATKQLLDKYLENKWVNKWSWYLQDTSGLMFWTGKQSHELIPLSFPKA